MPGPPAGGEEAADLAPAAHTHRPLEAVPVRQRPVDQVPQDRGFSCVRPGSHGLFGGRAGRHAAQVSWAGLGWAGFYILSNQLFISCLLMQCLELNFIYNLFRGKAYQKKASTWFESAP